jgi:hypothetical protein
MTQDLEGGARCVNDGCGRPAESGMRCESCELEFELFHRERRAGDRAPGAGRAATEPREEPPDTIRARWH